VVPPLQLLYDGPYAVVRCGPRSFTIRVGSRDEVIAISLLKAFRKICHVMTEIKA
jgi:hypothetical protein